MQKVYSLQRIGWKHLTLHEEDLKGLSVYSQVANLFNSYKPYAEAQKKFLK